MLESRNPVAWMGKYQVSGALALGSGVSPKPAGARCANFDRYRLGFWVVRIRQRQGRPGVSGSLVRCADDARLYVIRSQIVEVAGPAEFHHRISAERSVSVVVEIGRRSVFICLGRIRPVAPGPPLFGDAKWDDHEAHQRAILKFSGIRLGYALSNKIENAIRSNRDNQILRPLRERWVLVVRCCEARAYLIGKIGLQSGFVIAQRALKRIEVTRAERRALPPIRIQRSGHLCKVRILRLAER